jgi:competence protein ComEC
MSDETSKKSNFTIYPLLWLSICFATGILTANFISISWTIYLIICLMSAILTAIFIKQKIALIFLSIAFVSVGGLHFKIENQSVSANRLKVLYDTNQINSGDPIEIVGVLQSEPELSVGGVFLLIKSNKAIYRNETREVSGNIKIFAPIQNEQNSAEYEELNLQYGSKIIVACGLNREDSFLNSGVKSRKEIIDQQEIDATGNVKSLLLIEKISDSENFSLIGAVYKFRQELIEDFRNNFNSATSGILIASLLGNRNFLNKKTSEIFREGGTFHVLVISGLHITFIGGLVLLFVRFFTKKRLWQFILASAFLWIYALAVGAEVPVVRAALMFTILLFSQVIYRRGTLLNALGACVLILLAWRPTDLFNQSFQLTIVSVTAIIAVAFPLIENLRAIGSWSPSAENPFPPNVPNWLKSFCEMIYWRENVWKYDVAQQIWTANLFKSPYLKRFAEKDWQSILRYAFEGIVVSLVVQIWLLPLLIVYFHRLSFFSVILNLWVGINIALESFAAIFALLVAQINHNLAQPFIKFTELLNWFLLSIPQFLIENNIASARIPNYSGNFKAVYLLYFIPLIVLTFSLNRWNLFELKPKNKNQRQKNKSFLFSIFIILIALIVFHSFSTPFADGRLHVEFLDVGQGDSTFITFPNGETMLVDGGGKMNFSKLYIENEGEEPEVFEPDSQTIGELVVSVFLWEKGYSKVDYILATHADTDHIQGLSDVARNFGVKKAFFGRTPFDDEDFQKLFSVLEKRNIETEVLSRGENFIVGNVKIEVLFPEKDLSPEAISDNNHSVVLRLIYGNRKFLLTGDIEKETEKFLTENSAVQADVVKVAHHGSRTSSIMEFIQATKADYAVIPVGRKSRFGHPHKEVINRWQNSGAKIITTGERGTVSFSTNGSDLRMETFLK